MDFVSSRARLCFALTLPALALALACGGGSSSGSASSQASNNSPSAHTVAPPMEPFWASDSPSRPNRAHPLHPVTGTNGTTIALSAQEIAMVQASTPQAASAVKTPATVATLATPLRIVTGLFSYTYHQDSATTLQPNDMTTIPVQALVPNVSGGFDTYAGVGHSDGTFSIQNVPVGYYWLKIGRNHLWTNVDNVEWVFDLYGRADVVYPGTSPTNLSLSASNLNAWQGTDELFWTVPNAGFTISTKGAVGITNAPALGATALSSFTMEFVSLGLPLLDATKNDQAYLTQLTSRTASTETYRALGKVFNVPATTMADGGSATASGGFLDIPQSSTLHLGWKRSALAAMTPSVNPNATVVQTEFGLWASPLGTGMGIPGDAFQLFTYDSGSVSATTDLDLGDLAYGNPFPASWTPLAETYFTWSISYLAPGAGSAIPLLRSSYTATMTLPTATAPLGPVLSPVQNPRINGKDLFQNQVSVGQDPVIAWDAPATGVPTGYVVTVYQLKNNAGASQLLRTGSMRTAARQITVPPGLMTAGNTYVVTISAVRSPGVNYASNPFQSAFPYGTAPIASAIVAP
ncbi:MAG TPA: hypothetical protein VFF76_06345 [Holophagaceae bacterium]|jgi:hypothetical protein|nr:hypothetical protein [Holophagaceae bacterium]